MRSCDPTESPAERDEFHFAACTIIARNYLANAAVLAESFRRHHPGSRFYLLVVDGLPAEASIDPGICLIDIATLNIPRLTEMSFKYDVLELCTAVKPSLLSLLFDQFDEKVVAYFDPDILIMRPLVEISDSLASASIVLTPHLLSPIPDDGLHPSEIDILSAGTYNLGFIALKRSPLVAEFLRWWQDRLRDNCRVDQTRGFFVDQKWVDLVPGLFPAAHILTDDTYNVAYWNMQARLIRQADETYYVNGRPAAFFHFSGFDPTRPHVLSKHQNRIAVSRTTPLADLLDRYAGELARHGDQLTRQWKYGYGSFSTGTAITSVWRRLYGELDSEQRNRLANPFDVRGSSSFFHWAVNPSNGTDGLSPILTGILTACPDVARSFPDPLGQDRVRFNEWLRMNSSHVIGIEPQILFEENPVADFFGLEEATATDYAKSRKPDSVVSLTTGVNVYGYLRNEDGLGEVARRHVRALKALNVRTSLIDLSDLSLPRASDPTLQTFDSESTHSVNLICVNADQHYVVKSRRGQDFARARYNIGVWFWELPRFPERWLDRFDDYDEIWAASSFIANTLAPISPIPIIRIPPIVAPLLVRSGDRGRRRLRIGPEEFVFLFVFDFKSIFERKNPLAVVDAFLAAFGSNDKARLIIKCVNGEHFPTALASLQSRAEGRAIDIHNGYWSIDQLRDVEAGADAYVSLHRSEGFGLTIADAMAMGKPVIATGWSGNMDYMTVANSFPVRFELVQLDQDYGPYQAGETWANPSVEHAAELMRQVFVDPESSSQRGELARRDIATNFSEDRIANLVGVRLGQPSIQTRSPLARESRNDTGSTAKWVSNATNRDNNTALVSRGPRLQPPDIPPMNLQASLHGSAGRLVKRFVSHLLSYHSYYQNQINLNFANFIRQLAGDHDDTSRRLENAVVRLNGLEGSMQELHETLRLATAWFEADVSSAEQAALPPETPSNEIRIELADRTQSVQSGGTQVTDITDSVQAQKS